MRDEVKSLFNNLTSSVPSFRLSLNEISQNKWVKDFQVNEEAAKKEMNDLWMQIKLKEQQIEQQKQQAQLNAARQS